MIMLYMQWCVARFRELKCCCTDKLLEPEKRNQKYIFISVNEHITGTAPGEQLRDKLKEAKMRWFW